MKKWLIVGLILSLLIISSCKDQASESLTLVVIPSEESKATKECFTPFVDYLSQELGMEIHLLLVADYTAVIEAMKYGYADIARFGPFSYVLATQEADVEAIAAGVKANTGQATYHALIITKSDSGIASIEDLDGATFAYVDISSTSGYLLPATQFKLRDVEPSEVLFAGSHPAVIEAVRNGSVDAGAIADNRWYTALAEGVIEEGELDIIWESDPVPNIPITVLKSMDSELKAKLLQALLAVPPEIIEAQGVNEIGYAKIFDSDYDVIREVQEYLGLTSD